MSGSSRWGSPPRSATAWRMAARSTTAGTPVKSCISTRAGRNEISRSSPPSPAAVPAGQGRDVVVGDPHAVVVAQQVLEQDLQRVGQPADAELVLEGAQAVDLVAFAAGLERARASMAAMA